MSVNIAFLPSLPPMPALAQVATYVNQLIAQFNRQDTMTPLYAADTGTATAFAIAPIPGIKAYRVGQLFLFLTAHANSGADPTLNVNGCGAGIITWPDGTSLSAGDIASASLVLVACNATTPTFSLMSKKS